MGASGGSAKPCRLIAILPIEIGADPRQQFVDPALLAACADGIKRPSQAFLRIAAVEPAGFDQRCEDGPVPCGALVAGEQGVLTGRSHRPDGSPRELLSISMRPPSRNKARPSQWWAKQARALPIGDFDGTRGWAFRNPFSQFAGNRLRRLPPRRQALVRLPAADFLLHRVEPGNQFQSPAGDWVMACLPDLEQLAARMRHAVREPDPRPQAFRQLFAAA